ncbi:hypothetical protein BT67DRAFT_375033 [Trichocladium antarcticum]|uniref:Uncharacterized protein n=1 Tax=Trichocladium antarcticum TaxID=1450529 RepID=A0AAN6UPH3_9PEZI|nr:hypothetical protein BT67DRAFT_375033 [Trichocladium antarcticum]
MASSGGHLGGAGNKITKARGKMVMVKPILKKLPRSEKNSLDLDRGWDEQQVEQLANSGWDGRGFGYGYAGQARDVSFGFGPGDGSVVASGGSSFRAKFQHSHGRSGSQTSTASGPRAGFVHPFAQTPRTSTPPISYANSLASFDNGRDYSPTITEGEDDDGFDTSAYPHPQPHSHSHSHSLAHAQQSPALSQSSNLRRPSLNSQRTSYFPEIPASKPPSLRISTGGRSVSGTTASSRLAHGSLLSTSHSDLHAHQTLAGSLSPTTSAQPQPTALSSAAAAAATTAAQMSPSLRTSLDLAGSFPRLRSRSEVDTALRAEKLRAARRKFEERERAKEEKYDREMIRRRERRDTKEACRVERGEATPGGAVERRITPTGLGLVMAVTPGMGKKASRGELSATASAAAGGRVPPSGAASASAPATGMSSGAGIGLGIGRRRHTDSRLGTTAEMAERPPTGFASREYESVALDAPPVFGAGAGAVEDVRFEHMHPRRSAGAKRKTQGYWQGFILWLRTKLLRLGH